MKYKGFTLIELLIVVAIIAILAAIAVPNFLEAQVRAKVSRSRADMRSMVTALESYKVDQNAYPSDAGNGVTVGGNSIWRAYGKNAQAEPKAQFTIGFELSTPIAYLNGIRPFVDVFKAGELSKYQNNQYTGREYYAYTNHRLRYKLGGGSTFLTKVNRDGDYVLMGAGPDKYVNNGPGATGDYGPVYTDTPNGINYDPTNGTVSIGDLVRCPSFPDRGWVKP